MDILNFPFKSRALNSLQNEARQLISVPCSVFITGSIGTGKSLWAETIAKSRGPFLVMNPQNSPQTAKDWRVQLSSDEVQLFVLEDIDQWSHQQRNSLLMFLTKFEDYRGRFISTASKSIESILPQLHYRLTTRTLALPNPQECQEDLQEIVNFWLSVHKHVYSRNDVTLNSEAFQKLTCHTWRGGWSELILVLERAISFGQTQISSEHIIFDKRQDKTSEFSAGQTLAEMEKKLILQTLQLTASNKSQAARLLGISIRTLRNKLNEYRERGAYESI